MTLWNPLHLFSNSQRHAASDAPSGSFDPSRTSDPIGSDYSRPAIGFGETRIGVPAGFGEHRRRPLGFAAAEKDVADVRYRTEISFKRHHETPRASVPGDLHAESPQETWQTPEQGFADLVTGPAGRDDAPTGGAAPVANDGSPAEENIPFYRREIGFRRRHSLPSEAPETVVVDDEASEGHFDLEPEPVSAFAADVPEFDGAGGDSDESPVEAVTVEAKEKVPFYKRELSFRRKSVVAEESLEADAVQAVDEASDGAEESNAQPSWDVPAEDIVVAEAPDEVVTDEEAGAVAQTEPPVGETVEIEQRVPSADVGAAADVAADDQSDVVSDQPVDADAAETVDEVDAGHAGASDEFGPVPVAAAVAVSAPDPVSEDDGPSVEDGSPQGESSSRKEKRAAKSAKRKPARGGKSRRVVGLKIGASQIAAAVVVETDGGHELVELARRPLAAGIVVDGDIRDVDALSNALKAFFEDEKLPKKDVRIGLASNRIGVRTFDIVGIDDEARFDNAVRFKAHEVLPVAAHESVLDYRVLEERPNEAGEATRRVLLVVAPRDQVERYAEVADRVGIKLAGIDLEALGLLRTFVDPKPFAVREVDDTATVVVSIGHESSTLLVAGGGACEFTRVIDWGGGALEDAIATSLDVHPAEAATILRHLSLSGAGRQLDTLDDDARAKALEAVRLRLTPFARELVSSLQFYQTQEESLGIGGIVITGGTSHLEGLADALHQMIGVSVSVGDPLARVTCAGGFAPAIEAVIGSMAVPIGLAIEDIAMRGVDLLPKEAAAARSKRATMIAIGAPVAVALPLVALGFLYVGAHGKAVDNRAQLDAVEAEIAALPKPPGPEIDASIVGDEAIRATAVASVLGGRLAWDAVFSDLSRVLPENVWLKSLSATLPQAGNVADGTTAPVAAAVPGQAAPAPTAVVIEGYTYTQPHVARLLARLATLPSLQRVTLTSSARELVGKKDVVRFVIVADLTQNGGVS